jgi:hypothetical protein
LRQIVKGVFVVALLRNFSEAESRKIRRNHAIAVSQPRHQLPKLKRGCWEAMQQKHYRRIGCASFA